MQKNHHSPKDRDHQSDGIFRRKNRLSRDGSVRGDLWTPMALHASRNPGRGRKDH